MTLEIISVRINGFLSFNNFFQNFKSSENVIVGTNGTGKSNILKIIYAALTNHEMLSEYMNNVKNIEKEVRIILNFHCPEFNNLLLLRYLAPIFSIDTIYINIENILKKIKNVIEDNQEIEILCYYDNQNIIKEVNFKYCNCNSKKKEKQNRCDVEKISSFIYNLKLICSKLRNPRKATKNIKKENIDKENFYKEIVEQLNKGEKILQDITIKKNSEVIKNVIIDNNEEQFKIEDIDERHEYFNKIKEYYYSEMVDDNILLLPKRNTFMEKDIKKQINLNSLIKFVSKYGDSEDYIVTEKDFFLALLSTKKSKHYHDLNEYSICENVFDSYIEKNVHFCSLLNTNGPHETINSLRTYEKNMRKARKSLNIDMCNISNMALNQFLYDTNKTECVKKNVYEQNILEKIGNIFHKITGKYVKIILEYSKGICMYEYVVSDKNSIYDEYHSCSYGEKELLDFLGSYYCNDSNIILVDEICSHLASQNKITFRNLFLNEIENKNERKQIIMVTHDIELVSPQSNLIYFKMDNSNTRSYNINSISSEKFNKSLSENIEVLFSKKCLLVEGYHDYRLMECFLKVFDINYYNLIKLDGCGNKLWQLLDNLEIDYKIIYDFDVLNKSKSNKIEHETIKFYRDRLNGNDIRKVYIKFEDITEILKKSSKKKLFSIVVVLRTINTLCIRSNELSSLIDKCPTNDINTSFEQKHINGYIKHLDEFKSKYEECTFDDFEIECEKIFKNEIKKYKNNNFDDYVRNHPFYEIIDMVWKNIKTTDVIPFDNPDRIIENYIGRTNNKIFIWNSEIKDLEGFGKLLFGKTIKKCKWMNYSNEDIKAKLSDIKLQINNSENIEIKKLFDFLKTSSA